MAEHSVRTTYARPKRSRRLGSLLRVLHEETNAITATAKLLDFSVFQTIQSYHAAARRLNATLPDEIDEFLEEAGELALSVGSFAPVLCHNDLLAANILATEDRLWLIDWEYAGMGHPLFDLASVSANNRLSDSNEVELLMRLQGSVEIQDLERLRALKRLSLLREGLWGAIQTIEGGIAFDYGTYAQTNFQTYRQARGEPTAPTNFDAAS